LIWDLLFWWKFYFFGYIDEINEENKKKMDNFYNCLKKLTEIKIKIDFIEKNALKMKIYNELQSVNKI
jgi:hypothetical protein